MVPVANAVEQALGQVMPLGAEVTVPEPLTAVLSANVLGATAVNVAVTVRAADIVTSQVLLPLQAPLQPVNEKPDAGTAASRTTVPSA